MRERTAQASVNVSAACGYSARAGFVRVSVDSGRDDARERARASMRVPRSAGCGHDWFSFSSSSLLSWFSSRFFDSFASASLGFRSVVDKEEDARGGDAGMGGGVSARVDGC